MFTGFKKKLRAPAPEATAAFALFPEDLRSLEGPVEYDQKPDYASDQEAYARCARNLLRIITLGWQEGAQHIRKNRILADCVDKQLDTRFLHELKIALEDGFKELIEQLNNNSHDDFLAHCFIRNCQAMLPFLVTRSDQTFRFPVKIKNRWQLINYSLEAIALTPQSKFSLFTLRPIDKVYSYGLVPIDTQECDQAFLIHSGTTYPTGQGFWTQQFTNYLPWTSVGVQLFKHGKENLNRWCQKVKKKGLRIDVTGASLGGSLSQLCDSDHIFDKDTFSDIYAFNPAGWILPNIIKTAHNSQHLFLISQDGDPVSQYAGGYWSKHGEIIKISAKEKTDLPPNFPVRLLGAHIAIHSGLQSGVTYKKINAKDKNYSVLNALKSLIGMWLVRFGIFLASHVVAPLIKCISKICEPSDVEPESQFVTVPMGAT